MKKRKWVIIIIMCIIPIIFFLVLGNIQYHWTFMYSTENVTNICIIEVLPTNNHTFENENGYKILKEIDVVHAEKIFNDIQSLPLNKVGPGPSRPGGISIMISYNTGEYEVISLWGSSQYEYDSADGMILSRKNSYYVYRDEEQYYRMILEWLCMEE